jgi:lysophospholipase L1-like esterase
MLGGKPGRWVLAVAFVVLAVQASARAQTHVVSYGDSYVKPSAAGMREGQRPWVALLHEPVLNHGHAGDGAAATLAIVRRTAWEARVDAVVEVGINDVRRSGNDAAALAAFTTRYDALLDLLAHARRVVVVPPLPIRNWGQRGSTVALESYRSVVIALAGEHRNVRLADPLPAWRPDTMLLPDGLHPDASGRAVIAAAVRRALA